nr:hypothetical protein [Mycoplasmopsis bovis]
MFSLGFLPGSVFSLGFLPSSGFFSSSLVSPHLAATKGIEANEATDPSSKNFDFFHKFILSF